MKRKTGRRGFVLVMTLAIIAISGTLLVGLASHSLNLVAGALVYEQELQKKWGAASCQRFAFAQSHELLTEATWNSETNQNERRPRRYSAAAVVLGDQTFRIVVSDESAKLDANNLLARRSIEESAEIIRELARGPWRVALKPLAREDQRDSKEGYLECWDQVFSRSGGFNVADFVLATGDLTCWSSRLCIGSATDNALRQTAEISVGPIGARALVEFRNEQPDASVDTLLLQLDAPQDRLDRLRQMLSDVSMSQSVLISVSSPNALEVFLVIRESLGPGLSRYSGFSW